MKSKIKAGITVAVLVISQAVSALALDPPDRKQITSEDKVYFTSRLDYGQIGQIGKILKHKKVVGESSCEKSVSASKTLAVIAEVNPIFEEASESSEISLYARNYSKSLAQELSNTEMALSELLVHYDEACTGGVAQQTRTGL